MPNIDLLKEKIADSGISISTIAKKIGVTRETVYNRLNGVGEFKLSEITGITNAMRLTTEERDEIFFT